MTLVGCLRNQIFLETFCLNHSIKEIMSWFIRILMKKQNLKNKKYFSFKKEINF